MERGWVGVEERSRGRTFGVVEVEFLGVREVAYAGVMGKRKPRRKLPLRKPTRRMKRSAWLKMYAAYLRSPEWKNLRLRIFTERGRFCEKCGGEEKLSLHHLSYARVGNEEDEDLQILCLRCHCRAHGRRLWRKRKGRPRS